MSITGRIGFIAAVCMLLTAFASVGFCGLVITEADGTQTLVADGRIKSISADPEDEQMIVDMKKGTITVLNRQEKTASRGTIDEYCAVMKKMTDSMAQAMEQMKEQMKAQGMEDVPFAMPGVNQEPVDVRVEKIGDGGRIAGYPTIKYKIYADGELYEEAWICPDQELLDEMGDMDKLAQFEKCASQVMGANTVEATAEYQELTKSGWLLKSVDYEYGDAEPIVDVEKIEEKAIADKEFEIPDGYEKVPFSDLFEME